MSPTLPTRIERLNYLLAGLLAAIGVVFLSAPYALGLTVGAALSALHFSGLRWLVTRVRTLPEKRRKGAAMLFLPHLLVTMAAVVLALAYLPLSGGAFLIGFSIFFISIVLGVAIESLSPETEGSSSEDASS